jgi:hypothetical protein
MHTSLKILRTLFILTPLYMFWHSCVHHQEPLTLHLQPPVTLCRWVGCIFQLWSVTTVAFVESDSSDRTKLEDTTNPMTHGDWRLYVQNWVAPDDGCKSARNM